MTNSYSLFERAVVYGPLFLAAVFSVAALASAAFMKRFSKNLFAAGSALMLPVCAAAGLYAAKGGIIAGIAVAGHYAALAAVSVTAFILFVPPFAADARRCVLLFLAAASAYAGLITAGSWGAAACFMIFDLCVFAVIAPDGEQGRAAGMLPAKILFASAAAAFFAMFASGSAQSHSAAGAVVFILLSSNPGLAALKAGRDEASDRAAIRHAGLLYVSAAVQAALVFKFCSELQAFGGLKPVMLAAGTLAAINLYRSVTGENYALFTGRDLASPVFLLAVLMCGSALPPGAAVPVIMLFLAAAAFQAAFVTFYDRGRHTVSGIKYGFKKIKGARLALFGILSGTAAEVLALYLLLNNMKGDQLLQAAAIFISTAFGVSVLNKVFIIITMLGGIKGSAGYDRHAVKPLLYVLYSALIMAWWLK